LVFDIGSRGVVLSNFVNSFVASFVRSFVYVFYQSVRTNILSCELRKQHSKRK